MQPHEYHELKKNRSKNRRGRRKFDSQKAENGKYNLKSPKRTREQEEDQDDG